MKISHYESILTATSENGDELKPFEKFATNLLNFVDEFYKSSKLYDKQKISFHMEWIARCEHGTNISLDQCEECE